MGHLRLPPAGAGAPRADPPSRAPIAQAIFQKAGGSRACSKGCALGTRDKDRQPRDCALAWVQ